MGVFGDNLRKYYEIGLSCVPIKSDTKRPIFNGWQKYCENLPTPEEINEWENRFADDQKIGLCLGKSSGVVAFDFDYEYDEQKVKIDEKDFQKDQKKVERIILSMLPPTPCIKRGKKGWTRFYKWSEQLDDKSNVQCDRNGIRLFDFLSWHKQTIIPPSIHSIDAETGQAIFYKWTGQPIEDCLEELPVIELSVIDDIRALYQTRSADKKEKTRHEELLGYILLSLRLTKDIEKTVQLVIERDSILNNKNPYLTDKKHHSTQDAYKNAKKWVSRVAQWSSEKSTKTDATQIIGSDQETYFEFFKQTLPEHHVEMLSNGFLMKIEQKGFFDNIIQRWTPVENNLGALRSDAIQIGLKKADVEDHLMKYKSTLKPRFLFDIEKWDGVDRLDQICRTVPAVNYVYSTDKDEREYQIQAYASMIKHVCAGIFRRAFDSEQQNIATIIRGQQGKGKNTFIANVFGKPFTKFYWSEINVQNDQQKNYDAVDGLLVSIIGEFDQTSKVQISFLKELITNSGYSSRRAYDRRRDRYELHHTMFSASNFDSVLKDTTGNRRFNILDFPTIDWSYNKFLDYDQLRYQFYHLFEQGYEMTEYAQKMVNDFIAKENPEDPLDLALDFYKDICRQRTEIHWSTLDKPRLPRDEKEWSNIHITPIINEVCKASGVHDKWLRHRLKKEGLSRRSNSGIVFVNFLTDVTGVTLHSEG